MKAKLNYKLPVITVLASLILGASLLIIIKSPTEAASEPVQGTALSCTAPIELTQPDLPGEYYGQAIPLLEEVGGSIIELQSAYAGIPNASEKSLDEYSILKEGDT